MHQQLEQTLIDRISQFCQNLHIPLADQPYRSYLWGKLSISLPVDCQGRNRTIANARQLAIALEPLGCCVQVRMVAPDHDFDWTCPIEIEYWAAKTR